MVLERKNTDELIIVIYREETGIYRVVLVGRVKYTRGGK